MKTELMLAAMIKGVELMDAEFVTSDEKALYFNVKKGGQLDDDAKLKRAKDAFKSAFNIEMKIKMV